jgi:hypothetical protein
MEGATGNGALPSGDARDDAVRVPSTQEGCAVADIAHILAVKKTVTNGYYSVCRDAAIDATVAESAAKVVRKKQRTKKEQKKQTRDL